MSKRHGTTLPMDGEQQYVKVAKGTCRVCALLHASTYAAATLTR
jgi:hypothetical protein